MTPHKSASSAFLLLLLVVALWSLFQDRADPAPGQGLPKTVAVVDLFRVLSEAKPYVADQEKLAGWIEVQRRTNLEVKKGEVDAKQAELELLSGDSPERRRLMLELDQAKLLFDHEYGNLERERMKRITSLQKAAFADASRIISDYARNHGIDLVLQKRSTPVEGANQRELTSQIYLRDVLFADASLDITDRVITILNARR